MRRTVFILTILTGMILLAWVGFGIWNAEPRYQGRTLSYWLEQMSAPKTAKAGDEAIRAMGTNAAPHLVRLLFAEMPSWQLEFYRIQSKQSLVRIQLPVRDFQPYIVTRAIRLLGTNAAFIAPDLGARWRAQNSQSTAGVGFQVLSPGATRRSPGSVPGQARGQLVMIGLPWYEIPDLLTGLGPAGTHELILGLQSIDPSVKGQAASGLGTSADLDATGALLAALKRPDPVRPAVITALGRKRSQGETVIPPLLPFLTNAAPERLTALIVMANFGRLPPSALPALIPCLTNGVPDEKLAAFQGLTSMGAVALPTLPLLLEYLSSAQGYYRWTALQRLPMIDPEGSVVLPILVGFMEDDDPADDDLVISCLLGMGAKAKPAVPNLVKRIASEQSLGGSSAFRVLTKIDPETALRIQAERESKAQEPKP